MQNKSLVAGFLVLALGATSCKEDGHDHDDNTVLIEFLKPGNEQVIPMADASNVHIHVRFTATEENHEVAVKLYPEGDPGNLLLNFDLHDHDVVINVEEDLDLSSFAPGTEFHLEAEACENHDCVEVVSRDIHFTIN